MLKNIIRFIGRHVLLVILVALVAALFLFLAIASLIITIIELYLGYDPYFEFIVVQTGLWVVAIFFLLLFYKALDTEDKEYYEGLDEMMEKIHRGIPI